MILTTPAELMTGPPVPLHLSKLQMAGFYGGAMLVAAALTFLVLRSGVTFAMDAPDTRRKFHAKPIPRLGGAPIFLALTLGTAVAAFYGLLRWEDWMPVAICNTLMFSVGFIDDLKPLGAKVKLAGQVGTSLILYALGISIDILSNPFGDGSISLGWWSLPITVMWLVSIPNIVNLIDGMDGLAGGFGMFLCLTLAVIGHYGGSADVMVISLTMAGALAGFLVFNLPPAKIFLGDGGAYLIGFFVASVSLFSSNKGAIIGALLVIVIALGVPILDTAFAILRRSIRGVPVFSADAEHIHHRLILLGYSKGRALAVMYTVCVVLSLTGISILVTKGIAIPVAAALLFLLAVAAARYLGYVRSFKKLRLQVSAALERKRVREYFRARGRILDFEVERSGTLEEFDVTFRHALERMSVRVVDEQDARTAEAKLVTIKLFDGQVITLRHPADQESHTEWQLRLDELTPALDRCKERWGRLPASASIPKPDPLIMPN
ncbi:MAG: undecaprenyl/decaprenyl-phosphate alpha-N-acetylglucosaminyl 1-phosphate transferase [Verrucomicrobiaceae bacterium]|nr:undecaprenyl/decaprenyl-phosphate alpha-N-acetylglucosaminyl 1-phosphate transferase [Verrucomicrobiaceae bacterium]